MSFRPRTLALAVAAATGLTSAVHAEPLELGAWIGPHFFSKDSLLGYIDGAPAHPMLSTTVAYGLRIAKPFFPWLVPELELTFAPTQTDSFDVNVFWLDPRIQLRFELMPGKRVQPFLVVGGGALIAISSARKTFDSDLLGNGYGGAGVRFDTRKGFSLRFDARLQLSPGVDSSLTTEFELGLGVELHTHEAHRRTVAAARPVGPTDSDGDGIPDAVDQCPDRPEDKDGFEDADGCPDIDNDKDGILDIADKCPNVPETYNGYQDEDGCPDTLPPEVDALKGTVEGLLYAAGETVVRDSALPGLEKLAKIMRAHPGIKVVLVGYTDDREATEGAAAGSGSGSAAPAEGSDAGSSAAEDLSRARAEAVRQAMIKLGVASGHITVEGRGAEEPVAENDKPRGRLANRRVEIKLFVPQR